MSRLFDTVVAEDVLPHVLHRWGPIPGVRTTRDLTGPWDTPGSRRTVVLEDGSTAREEVREWRRPERFAYRVDALSGPFGRLVDHAVGEWEFAAAGATARFTWTYTFTPRGPISALLLRVFVPLAWARYMAACADRCAVRALTAR